MIETLVTATTANLVYNIVECKRPQFLQSTSTGFHLDWFKSRPVCIWIPIHLNM
ncbi:hypothetical protein NC652_035258 [Populus alba x Populus x berolinensis]|nr:hypothetical protein NC652_035240 [Populus alba x Populus x berolinensis]KAJ6875827.1 hypothetical protein NC652_035258 [Populus alba x Populus x berolinensis]